MPTERTARVAPRRRATLSCFMVEKKDERIDRAFVDATEAFRVAFDACRERFESNPEARVVVEPCVDAKEAYRFKAKQGTKREGRHLVSLVVATKGAVRVRGTEFRVYVAVRALRFSGARPTVGIYMSLDAQDEPDELDALYRITSLNVFDAQKRSAMFDQAIEDAVQRIKHHVESEP
jgi:hypothetical protein